MVKHLLNRIGGRTQRVRIIGLAVWLLVIGIALPKPVYSGCGAISTNAKKGDVISIKVENGQIEGNLITTHNRKLVLYVEFEGGNPSFFQICDNELFGLCDWQRMRFDGKITYTLSEGAGMKKIYLRAKFLNKPGRTKLIRVNYLPS